MAGALYVVATPIGNLEDMSLRAIRVLKEVSVIACEDTRHTRKLLAHYGIETPVLSCHEHNEAARAAEIAARLERGETVALVSDAGTPLVEDPGYRVVALAVERGFKVEPVPGPCAAVAALSASGLPTDAFFFGGFLPAKAAKRRARLQELSRLPATLVFYEAPHRILETLADCRDLLGSRRAVVARELTKLHEEFLRGTFDEVRAELARRPAVKGELVLLVDRAAPESPAGQTSLEELYQSLVADGMPHMEAVKEAARRSGIGKREAYRILAAQRGD